jgi:hypothetical protein
MAPPFLQHHYKYASVRSAFSNPDRTSRPNILDQREFDKLAAGLQRNHIELDETTTFGPARMVDERMMDEESSIIRPQTSGMRMETRSPSTALMNVPAGVSFVMSYARCFPSSTLRTKPPPSRRSWSGFLSKSPSDHRGNGLARSSVPFAGPLAPLVVDRQRNEVVIYSDGRQAVPELQALILLADDPASEQFLDSLLRTVRPKVDRNGFERRDLGPRHAFARVFGHLRSHFSRLSCLDLLHRDYSRERA